MKGPREEKRMDVWAGMSLSDFVKELNTAGFTAKRLAEAVEIYERMLDDEK